MSRGLEIGEAYISSIEGNRAGRLSERVKIIAAYRMADTVGSIIFEVTLEAARGYYIGQKLTISIAVEE